MKAIVVFAATVATLLATPMASESRTITAKMDSLQRDWDGLMRRIGIAAVYTDLRTSAGDTIVAIARTRNYNGFLIFRGNSTWLTPGTVVLTNAQVRVECEALFGDSTGQDTRPVRIVATGLRTDEMWNGGTVDKNAGLKVYGYLKAYHLQVEGFNNPPYGLTNWEGQGTGIVVQHGGWLDLHNSQTSGNIGGLMVPGWGNAPAGSRITRVRTWGCTFQDAGESLQYNPHNRAIYRDEYSQFTKRIMVDGEGYSDISPDSLGLLSATFVGSVLPAEIIAWPVLFTNGTINISRPTPSADFDNDGTVGFSDFFLFVDSFGQGTAQAKLMQLAREYLGLPEAAALEQNYPNPFNAETTINYNLLLAGPARLTIYNLNGQAVRTLWDGPQEAGQHQARWDGTDDSGQACASGTYLYQLRSGAYGGTRRLLLLK